MLYVFLAIFFGILQVYNAEDEKPSVFNLDEIVVTATRYPVKLKKTPATVSIISKKDIEKSNVKKVNELLNNTPGVNIRSYGSLGTLSEINIRGLISSQVLVLLDGRPINSPSTGTVNLSEIPVDNIEKIEIVHGPASALYGANAVGGVVNIITKDVEEKFTTKIDGSYGTYNTQIYKIKIENNYKFDKSDFGYLIAVNKSISDGARQNSKYDGSDLTGKFQYDLYKKLKTSLNYGFHQDELGLPGSQPAEDVNLRTATQKKFGNDNVSSLNDKQKDKKWYIDVSSDLKLSKQSELLPKVYAESSNLDFHQEYVSSDETYNEDDIYKTNVYGTDLQYHDYGIIENQIFIFGVNFREEQFDANATNLNLSNNSTTITKWGPKATIKAVYAEDEINITDKLTTFLGVRYDYHSAFKDNVNPRLSTIYKLADTTLRVSIGRAFRAPTLNDLYWPERATDRGNPDLKPETAWAYEIGLESGLSNVVFGRLSLFRKDIKDMIAWAPTGPVGVFGPKWQPSNINTLVNQGVEFEMKFKLSEVTTGIGYTFIDAKQTNKEVINSTTNEMNEVSRIAYNVPRHQINCNVGYESNFGLNIDVSGRYVDRRYSYYANYSNYPVVSMDTKELPAYFVTGFKVMQRLFEEAKLFISVDNIFDVKYREIFGSSIDDRDYPKEGRTFTGGITLIF